MGSFSTQGTGQQTLIEHWNGAHWKVVSSPVLPETTGSLNGVAVVSDDNVWAVGEYQDSSGFSGTLIEHWNGHSWQIVPSPNPGSQSNFLQGVAVVSAKNAWAVGELLDTNGTELPLIEHWDGSTWQAVSSPNGGAILSILQAVAAVSHKDVWAVGGAVDQSSSDVTLIEAWNGAKWRIVPSPTP